MLTAELPEIGTRVVHVNNHARGQGPIWEVEQVEDGKVALSLTRHKLNAGRDEALKVVTLDEFRRDYIAL